MSRLAAGRRLPRRSWTAFATAVGFALLSAIARADASADLKAIADQALAWRTSHDPYLRLLQGLPIARFMDLTEAGARSDSAFASELLVKLATVDRQALSAPERAFLETLAEELEVGAAEHRFYWLNFAVTPYRGGDIHQLVFQLLAAQDLADTAACERYAALAGDYARVLDEIRAKTLGQRQRGILLPKPAIPNAWQLLDGLIESTPASLVPSESRLERLAPADRAACRVRVERLASRQILPRLRRLKSVLGESYLRDAPAAVGLAQYPDGRDYYRHLIRRFTSLALTPAEIHQLGLRRIAEFDQRMAALRAQLGFTGTRAEFHQLLRTDPRWIAQSPDDVERRFMGFIRRMEPLIPQYFSVLPKAPYGVKRLDPADEPGMTYGYYQPPTPGSPTGLYRYNGSDLAERSLVGAQHLIYHELIPGHHFQIALQRETTPVHPLQTHFSSNAFSEGWAEYGASLAEDAGLYEGYDLYGRLLMQSHLAARLVLDTGLNELGWSLERAREYLADHSLQSPAVVAGETLRYSTDIPGQALGYFLGYEKMRDLRTRATAELGPQFDLRAFNDTLLGSGSVPLSVLEHNVDRFIAARKGATAHLTHFAAVNTVGVDIAAAAGRVWRALLDRTAWNSTVVAKARLRGDENATGEVALFTLRDASGHTGERLEEMLLALPGERLVIRLAPRSEDATYAFADFRISPRGKASRLDMTVYWTDEASGAPGSAELAQTRTAYVAATQAKMTGDLARLKAAAEAK